MFQLSHALSDDFVESDRWPAHWLEPCCDILPEAWNLLHEMCCLRCTRMAHDAESLSERTVVIATGRVL